MTLTSKPLAAIVLAILFGGILFTTAMGWWKTESTKEAAKFTAGEFAGQANPADIRGSYTFGDVEKNFGIPSTVLAQAFGVSDANPADFPVKNLETIYSESDLEVGTASVRLFVAFYKNLPFDLSTDMYLPESAAELLKEQTLTPEQIAYLENHTLPGPAAGTDAPQPASTPSADSPSTPAPAAEATHTTSESDRAIKGKTTFGEILGWGVPREAIEAIIGGPLPASSVTPKDYCLQNGLNFEDIKTRLQAEVDKIK
jgi:hypothetical protein